MKKYMLFIVFIIILKNGYSQKLYFENNDYTLEIDFEFYYENLIVIKLNNKSKKTILLPEFKTNTIWLNNCLNISIGVDLDAINEMSSYELLKINSLDTLIEKIYIQNKYNNMNLIINVNYLEYKRYKNNKISFIKYYRKMTWSRYEIYDFHTNK